MDEKMTYAVYVDLLRIHKEFCKKDPNYSERKSFVQKINVINSNHNSCFCFSMCNALYNWFLKGFIGITDIGKYYSELWHFHKAYLNQPINELDWGKTVKEAEALSGTYKIKACEDMVLAIVTDLDSRIKQQAGA